MIERRLASTGMKVAVVRETLPGERRVALVPDAVPRLVKGGIDRRRRGRRGRGSGFSDAAYRDAGADVGVNAVDGAGVLVAVQPPRAEQVDRLAAGALVVSFLPNGEPERGGRLPMAVTGRRGQSPPATAR